MEKSEVKNEAIEKLRRAAESTAQRPVVWAYISALEAELLRLRTKQSKEGTSL